MGVYCYHINTTHTTKFKYLRAMGDNITHSEHLLNATARGREPTISPKHRRGRAIRIKKSAVARGSNTATAVSPHKPVCMPHQNPKRPQNMTNRSAGPTPPPHPPTHRAGLKVEVAHLGRTLETEQQQQGTKGGRGRRGSSKR
eukprot:scaffold117914_cov36-Tisochrysis_lutea.AAC.5